ncbi:hypothetical protein B0T22DRAFT_298655 [Podospora appendiculata]|uniref:DUF1308 domain-containing protein n=1 Tax=Podospora appendiculata TaxID=314037 RepID=A0AAE0WZY2_9PEZI|nr:hypothetical protein B0T22DRAFT_298655 [Podospora appendiculata]
MAFVVGGPSQGAASPNATESHSDDSLPPTQASPPSRSPESGPAVTDNDESAAQYRQEAATPEAFDSLFAQWKDCIQELRQLQRAADSSPKPIRALANLIKVQQRALDKVIQKTQQPLEPKVNPIAPAQYFGVRSCCFADKWAVIKKCRGLVAIDKWFPRSPRLPVPARAGWLAFKDRPFQENQVNVDAVVDCGATWLKFISISPKSLAFQVVTEGWESDGDGDDEDRGAGDGLGNTEFAESIKKIVLAARWNHCHHIHLALSSLQEGVSDEIDRMVAYVRERIGGPEVSITVSCAGSPFLTDKPPPLDEALSALIDDRDKLVSEDCSRLTQTVNLDPSVLVSLVTDLHHGPIAQQPLPLQQIITNSILHHETENNELVSRQDILANVLYPALRGRKLVCTRFAAKYFQRVIESISTHSEEIRARMILPPGAFSEAVDTEHVPKEQADAAANGEGPDDENSLRKKFQEWSNVPVPEDLHLPVEIVDDVDLGDVERLILEQRLPPMALGVTQDLSLLNRSVYLHGWANKITTISGHRGIERQVTMSVATHWTRATDDKPDAPNDYPPDIWHRHIGGYLIHRDKPKNWPSFLPLVEAGQDENSNVPAEMMRWTRAWTTWGRGISTYGLPDTKTWDGVGHDDKQSFGRRMTARESRDEKEYAVRSKVCGGEDLGDDGEGEQEQSWSGF